MKGLHAALEAAYQECLATLLTDWTQERTRADAQHPPGRGDTRRRCATRRSRELSPQRIKRRSRSNVRSSARSAQRK